ncbi:uncharacterized protein [Haliotis cracherodii]|uniref:uncharacterized protein n=1 Tax=Haliotis cracherodii TaxID=6455 RepID=UPI0039E9A371
MYSMDVHLTYISAAMNCNSSTMSSTKYHFIITDRRGRTVHEDERYYSDEMLALSIALELVKSTQFQVSEGPYRIQLGSYNFVSPLPKEMKIEKQRLEFEHILDGYYVAALRDGIEIRIKETNCPCPGCEISHPSQRQHTCLYPKSYSSEVTWYFDEVMKTLTHEDLFRKAKQHMVEYGIVHTGYDPLPFHEDETWVRQNYLTDERQKKWTVTLQIIMD